MTNERDSYSSSNMEGQISQQVNYFITPNLVDQHPPYIPPFQVEGLAPGSAQDENGLDLAWNFGFEPKRKKPKEQPFFESNFNYNSNNSQISCLDFLDARSVSTAGLGLSLENPRLASSGELSLFGVVGDDLDSELRQRDAEIDRYLKLQGDRLRQAVLEKFQENQLKTISLIEEKVVEKLREKEVEVENIINENMDLELRIQQLTLEANAWQQCAKHNENMINTLKLSLQQVYAQSRDSKEGCGDSEVDDTASFCNGRPVGVLCKDNNNGMESSMICKICRVNEVRMLLLPCKHLCLCKDCESKLSLCPVCETSKYIGMEVYM